MPYSVFAATSRCTLSDLAFLSTKICDCSMPVSRWMWHFAHPSCLWMLRSSHERSSWNCMGLMLPQPTCWLRLDVFTKWFLSDFSLNVRTTYVVGPAVQRICVACSVTDSCCKTSWKNFLIIAFVVSGGDPIAAARVDLFFFDAVVLRLFELLQSLFYGRVNRLLFFYRPMKITASCSFVIK